MPANLTPQYFKAEQLYKTATTNEEKILALEEMLRVIPKHKGTEHIQGDLKRKLSQLRDAATQQKKSGKHVDIFHVPRGGAGQVVLLGTPNCGKSSIVAALTNAKVHVADFPFATAGPVPGMMKFEDVPIQLVDMPPITADYSAPGQVGTYRTCDIIAVVIDLSADVEEQWLICLDFLESHNLLIDEQTPARDDQGNVLGLPPRLPTRVGAAGKKILCICTKSDVAHPGAMEKLRECCNRRMEFVEISTVTRAGLDKLATTCFEMLGIIRVYAKPPGKPADMAEPFTLPIGSTVMDMATLIHRQLAEKLRSSRIWGTGVHDGQPVQRTHVLNDKDVVELHFP